MSKLIVINATASSQFSSDFRPEFSIDGVMSTRWASLNKTGTQYIQFDLGKIYTVESIKCACGSAYQPETFDLLVSDDGINFNIHETNLTINTTDTLQEFILTEIDASHIRLLMKSTKSANFYELKEFEVYGREPITASLISIELVKPPNKLVYFVGDSLDLGGVEVLGSYDDGTTKPIVINNSMTNGFDSSTNIAGQIITIDIGGFIVSFAVDIIKNKGAGKQIAIKFTEDLLGDVMGNESAFTVTGKEYKYVQGPDNNGPLVDKTYKPISVERHPTINKAILLSFPTFEEFNNVVGDVTISYDAQIGNLSGRGGRVDSFTVNFSPLDLIATPNPGVTEIITVAPVEIIGKLLEIEYIDRYSEDHTITVAPVEIIGTLVHISEINP